MYNQAQEQEQLAQIGVVPFDLHILFSTFLNLFEIVNVLNNYDYKKQYYCISNNF